MLISQATFQDRGLKPGYTSNSTWAPLGTADSTPALAQSARLQASQGCLIHLSLLYLSLLCMLPHVSRATVRQQAATKVHIRINFPPRLRDADTTITVITKDCCTKLGSKSHTCPAVRLGSENMFKKMIIGLRTIFRCPIRIPTVSQNKTPDARQPTPTGRFATIIGLRLCCPVRDGKESPLAVGE